MNHSIKSGLRQITKSRNGYTIIEAIIAIAVCGFGLAIILGLYGMAIKTEMVSKNIFEQSVEINSIADEINLSLKETSTESLAERVTRVLNSKYTDYRLEEVSKDSYINLYKLEISHQGQNSLDKRFHIKVFWRPNE